MRELADVANSCGVDLKPTRVSVRSSLRERVRSRWPEWIALLLYATVVTFAIPYHEPWVDEAQSWQLARSLPLVTLFQKHLRYEGSPGLWHLLLWVLSRAHVNYVGIHWICGAIAVVGVSILVLTAPLPRYLKLSLPFTYFLLFQYAVVARNYVFVPLILFMIASRWKRSTVVVALLLGLLANTALHAAVISGGLAVVYAIERLRAGDFTKSDQRRNLLFSAAILLCFYAFAIWTTWPPHDQIILGRIRGESKSYTAYFIVSLVRGVCQPWPVSILFWIAIGLCLRARHSLFYMTPILFFACFCAAGYATWLHVGLLIPLVICLVWISWPMPETSVSRYEIMGRSAMVVMVGTQILWSVYVLAYDHSRAYSPDLAASKFLQTLVRENAKIAVTSMNEPWIHSYEAVGILPYFDHNIYMNLPNAFWSWSSNDPTEKQFAAALDSQPRIVLVEIRPAQPESIELEPSKLQVLTQAGYKLTNVFCGAKPERLQRGETNCHLIFQHFASSQGSPTSP
jgi:hypothetical protein